MLGAGFIGWGGGIDFLEAYIAPLQRLNDCEIYIFIPQESWAFKCMREIWYRFRTIFLRKNLVRYAPPCTVDELTARFHADHVHVIVYPVWRSMISNIKSVLKKYHIDIVFPTILNLGKTFPLPWIPYLPDLQHKYYPEFFSEEEIKARDVSFQQLLHSARSVIVEAQDVKKDLQKFYSVKNTKIFVMPYTAIPKKEWFSLDDVQIDKYHLPDQYFLISNQFWMHKDHGTAFAGLKLLHDAGYEQYHIVCTGQTDDYRNRAYFQNLIEALRKNHLEAYVHFLGYIPKIEQIKILRQAQAALQPTLFEGNPGGGIAYNAIAMGVPILLSDIPVNLELQSPLAFFFKKHDPESLKEAMIDLIMHRAELPSYSQEELLNQGEARVKMLAQAVYEALQYGLEEKKHVSRKQ